MNKKASDSEKAIPFPRGVKVLNRIIDVMDILGEYPSGLTLSEICNYLKLPKSTVHRILSVLLDRQYVRETFERDRYALGYEILRLARSCQAGLNFLQEAHPILMELNKAIDENVILAALDKSRHLIIYLDKLDSSKTIHLISHVGEIAPIHCTALGKALLSGFSDEELIKVLSDYEFKRYTDQTITDITSFLLEIDKIRKQGFSVDIQEYRDEVICMAAPIYSEDGKPLAAVGVSAPANRLDQSKLEQVEPFVVETAKKINELIAYIPLQGSWG